MKKILFFTLLLFANNGFGQVSTNNINVITWKKGYEKMPFWNKTINHPGEQGYIDTFTINNIHFRIIHNDALFDGTVQFYKGNKWTNNIEFKNLGNHNDYDITNDLDGDGNNDLIFYWKWYGEIYFFDKKTKHFSDSVDCSIARDWTTLNSSKHIYFENQFGKLINSPVHSNLFAFENKKRTEIASLEMNFDTNYDSENGGNLTKCRLFINNIKNSIESFKLTSKVSVDEYNLEKYWKTKLKKISSYSKH